MEHESTSLYCTLHHEDRISAKLMVIENLYQWFGDKNPRPPIPELGNSCVFYQNLSIKVDE
jgi:hypothetical protein